jgi:hypothetical protein
MAPHNCPCLTHQSTTTMTSTLRNQAGLFDTFRSPSIGNKESASLAELERRIKGRDKQISECSTTDLSRKPQVDMWTIRRGHWQRELEKIERRSTQSIDANAKPQTSFDTESVSGDENKAHGNDASMNPQEVSDVADPSAPLGAQSAGGSIVPSVDSKSAMDHWTESQRANLTMECRVGDALIGSSFRRRWS